MDDVEIQAQIAKKVHPDARIVVTEYRTFENKCYVNMKLFDLLETDDDGEPTQQAKERALDTMIAFHLTAYRYTTGLYGARHCMGSLEEGMNAPTVCVAIFEAAKKELKAAECGNH